MVVEGLAEGGVRGDCSGSGVEFEGAFRGG